MKNKIILKKEGFYKEMLNNMNSNESILSNINSIYSSELIDKVCEYLNSGIIIVGCFDFNTDIISNDNTISGNSSLYTDGTHIWPGDLSYYVKKYNLKINDDFLTFMESSNWKIDKNLNDLKQQKLYIENKRVL